ncbi:SCO1664 family protein [Egicoccus sp. AB-alg2]|uniref:SCO1664 family protein n=1 Tax=Egicoccus sp. AB-alg2 TaxID=3242693 RepID=UPI00359D5AD3
MTGDDDRAIPHTAAGPAAPGDPVRRRLLEAPLEMVGQFADASNATLLVRLRDRDRRSLDEVVAELGHEPSVEDLDPSDLAVYKPRRGETPLWDFPEGTLHAREVAAFEVSDCLGWDLVPATVRRSDAPFGVGSLQRFVPHDPEQHYFWLLEHGEDAVVRQLQAMVVFDLLIDNADRKGGHVLLEQPGSSTPPDPAAPRIQLVDHGVSFSTEPKLRTVAWHFAGEPVPPRLRDDVAVLAADFDRRLRPRLDGLLDDTELATLVARAGRLADLAVFPHPQGPRPFPWPLL